MLAAGGTGRLCAMPNTQPPVFTVAQALAYRAAVQAAAGPAIDCYVSLYLHAGLTPAVIEAAAREEAILAVKYYPRGVTTNSAAGGTGLAAFAPILEAMQACGLVLQVHGEVPSDPERGIDVLNAEARFMGELKAVHARFPALRIVLEHVSSRAGVACVRQLGDTVAATVTAHHLDLTVDDWAGRIHNFCKPVAKRYRDRDAIREAVVEGHPRFFLGSDSAPHERGMKETACGCAGVFTSPFLMPYLADCFERLGALPRLADFAACFGHVFYGLPPGRGAVTLKRTEFRIPAVCDGVVPYRAGEQLRWQLQTP